MIIYKWNGDDNVELTGVGIVKKGQEFQSEKEINHPHAEVMQKGNAQQQPKQEQKTDASKEQGKENN